MKVLESKGFITRETKNVKGGKERHIKINTNKIEEALTTDKLSIVKEAQQTNCPLTTDKLSIDKGQNDLIKDNIKDNLKDNNSGVSQTTFERTPLEPIVEEVKEETQQPKVEEVKVDGEITAFDLEWKAPTYKVIDKEKNLIQFPTGKVFKVV